LRAGAIGFGQHRQVSAKLALRSSRKGAAAWVLLLKYRQRLVDGGGRIGSGTVSAGAGLGVIGVSVRTSLPADRLALFHGFMLHLARHWCRWRLNVKNR
jgi:hypothetical protein